MEDYGYPRDLLDPPDGSYPFIEFSDLSVPVQSRVLLNLMRGEAPMHVLAAYIAGALADKPSSLDEAVEWARERLSEHDRKMSDHVHLAEKAALWTRHHKALAAMPGEIKGVLGNLAMYPSHNDRIRTSTLILQGQTEPKPPAWLMVRNDSGGMRLALPGEMLTGVICEEPVLLGHVQHNNTWSYRIQVFML